MNKTRTISESTTLVAVAVRSRVVRRGWCPACSAVVSWLDVPFAEEVLKASSAIAIHIDGELVCSRSLLGTKESGY